MASRGTPSNVTELPKIPWGQVGDDLFASRHAIKQIKSSIEVTQNYEDTKPISPNG